MKKNLTITLEAEQYKKLCEVAAKEDRSKSAMVRVILFEFFNMNEFVQDKIKGTVRGTF